MLINFNFSNFKSFKNYTEFTLEPASCNGEMSNVISTDYKKIPYVYRTSALFGANASGKSNFIDALYFFRELVLNSFHNSTTSKLGVIPYRLASGVASSKFEIEFIKNGYCFRYLVELNNDEILKEEAYYREIADEKREKCVFKRTSDEFNSPYGIDKDIAKQTIKTRLLLSELVNNRNSQDEITVNMFDWFAKDLLILNKDNISDFSTSELYYSDLDKITDFLKKADINIHKLKMERKTLQSIHKDEKGNDILFDFYEEESEGTVTLFELSDMFIGALNYGKVIVFDELDNSLHPLLVKYLVRLFNEEKSNKKNAQLIFSSHAHYLMDGNLSRDQIWFTSKENGYSSDLYSLSDFEQIKRKKGNFSNEYMYGIFGAIPNISED